MELIGKIKDVFSIHDKGDVIVTDRVVGPFNPNLFPEGTILELRDPSGICKRVSISSAELALDGGRDYLSFILQDRVRKNEIQKFDEVWCGISLA